MTGGIIQLVAYGREDLFLTRDPQITYFKITYRRHTNFAREEVCQEFIHDPNFAKKATCLVAPGGDLIDGMALRIKLPEIPKFIKSDGSDAETKVAWIRNIGFAMIKSVELEINGMIIDKHYGEWLYIWAMLTTNNINDQGLKKLIGDVPELTEFTNGKDEYTLYVKLQFWFCRASGLALPLVALQYSDIKVNVEFYPIDKCYVLLPTHYIQCEDNIANFYENEYLVQKGSDGIERYGLLSHYDTVRKRLYYTNITENKFIGIPYAATLNITDTAFTNAIINTPQADKYVITGMSSGFFVYPGLNAKSITSNRRSLRNIDLKECVLLVDYVFLDDDERFKFAQTKHDYLIETLYFTNNISIESTNRKVRLVVDQPCKLQVWLAQLDYISKFNDRFNYTDSHIIKRKYDENKNHQYMKYQFRKAEVNQEIGKSLINNELILLNSQDRLSQRSNTYFNNIQSWQHSRNNLPLGCGMYSYALLPFDVTPSGTTNMSQIELIELKLNMNYKVNDNNKAKFRSYSLCYDVWRVNNGLNALVFIR